MSRLTQNQFIFVPSFLVFLVCLLMLLLPLGSTAKTKENKEQKESTKNNPPSPAPKEFVDESEKDYKLRTIGTLNITHVKGDVTVQGWSFDKVRIKVRKRVFADSEIQANHFFKGIDYRYLTTKDNIEVASQYGAELTIEERLREKENPRIKMDITIFAPSSMNLRIWSVDGKVNLKSWNKSTEIRSNTGQVRVESLKGKDLSLLCAACTVQLKNIRTSSLRTAAGEGSIELSNIVAQNIYAETSSGRIKLWHIEGSQVYTSQSGSIEGQSLSGRVEFHSQQGSIDLKETAGFLSGSVESGNININARSWEFLDKALIESIQGDITLVLPRRFSADVDIWSIRGKVQLDFPIDRIQNAKEFGPEPENRLIGRIRDGGELLKVFSENGTIRIFKREL